MFNEEQKQKLKSIEEKIKKISEEVFEFSNELKSEMEKKKILDLEEKLGFKIDDCVTWKGVKAKIVGFSVDEKIKVSICVGNNLYSKVVHVIDDIKEISK